MKKSEGLGADFFDEIEKTIAQALAHHPDSDFLLTNHGRACYLIGFLMR